ncbi:uncharacterized protein LOC116178742 [Photinus pyralis]|nr:uncharacterized protein LOC116178742 [Photinus pyralis]
MERENSTRCKGPMNMRTLLSFFLAVAITQLCGGAIISSVEDYFWRDYSGIVPKDAYAAGTDANGQPTYVAQISIPYVRDPRRSTVDVIPAVLRAGEVEVYAPYNFDVTYVSAINSSLKVLCVYSSSYYKWHSLTTPLPSYHRYVVVGYESSRPLYLGRAVMDNQTLTGKIYADDRRRLIAAYQGGQVYLDSFTILTYYR